MSVGPLLKMVNMGRWLVIDVDGTVTHHPTPELASEELEKLGVKSDEIDVALTDMFSKEHNTAMFTDKGSFEYSDIL